MLFTCSHMYLCPCYYAAFFPQSTDICTGLTTTFGDIFLHFYSFMRFGMSELHVMIVMGLICPHQQPLRVKWKPKPHSSQAHRLPSVGLQTEVQMDSYMQLSELTFHMVSIIVKRIYYSVEIRCCPLNEKTADK